MTTQLNQFAWRLGVEAATTANLASTFVVGATPGIGDTLTGTSPAAFAVDGYTANVNDRILVKNQTAGLQNGIYSVITKGSASSGVGPIATVGSVTGGSGYLSGSYTGVPLSGGTGTGAVATIAVTGPGSIFAKGSLVGGSGYLNGQYVSRPLTGGSGSGATATLLIQGGSVVQVTMTAAGTGYAIGNVLSATTGVGPIASHGSIVGGSLYTDGTYTGVALTGGSGTGALATIVVASGAVTTVTITTAGTGYQVGDVLSATAASIGGTGSGFSTTVATVTAAGSGFSITVTQVLAPVATVTITTAGTGYTVGDTLTASALRIGGTGTGFTVPVATVVPSNWVLKRTSDTSYSNTIPGATVFVNAGSTNAKTAWVQTASPVVIDTTALVFAKFVN